MAFGAFGAHGLKKHIPDPQRLANWSTAAHYEVTRPTLRGKIQLEDVVLTPRARRS